MAKFCTYTTNADQDPQAITGDEYDSGMRMPNDWADYVWQDADNSTHAIEQHNYKLDIYMAGQNVVTLAEYLEGY